jgi:hypothetical protein
VLVTATVTGGTLVLGILVLVSSPPQAASIIVVNTNTDKSTASFLIRTNSFSKQKIWGYLKKHATLSERWS